MKALDVLFSVPTMMKLMVFGFFMAILVGGHRGTDDMVWRFMENVLECRGKW